MVVTKIHWKLLRVRTIFVKGPTHTFMFRAAKHA